LQRNLKTRGWAPLRSRATFQRTKSALRRFVDLGLQDLDDEIPSVEVLDVDLRRLVLYDEFEGHGPYPKSRAPSP
jgi:hypothetical protein